MNQFNLKVSLGVDDDKLPVAFIPLFIVLSKGIKSDSVSVEKCFFSEIRANCYARTLEDTFGLKTEVIKRRAILFND